MPRPEYKPKGAKKDANDSLSFLDELTIDEEPRISNRRNYEPEDDSEEEDGREEYDYADENIPIEDPNIEATIDNGMDAESYTAKSISKITKDRLVAEGYSLRYYTFEEVSSLDKLSNSPLKTQHEIKVYQEENPTLCEFKAAWIEDASNTLPVTISASLKGLCQENTILHHTSQCAPDHIILPPNSPNKPNSQIGRLLMFSNSVSEDEFLKENLSLTESDIMNSFQDYSCKTKKKTISSVLITNYAVREFAKSDPKRYEYKDKKGTAGEVTATGKQRLIDDLKDKLRNRKTFSTNDPSLCIKRGIVSDVNKRDWKDTAELISSGHLQDETVKKIYEKQTFAQGKVSVTICVAYKPLN